MSDSNKHADERSEPAGFAPRTSPHGRVIAITRILTPLGPMFAGAVARANGDNRLAILVPRHRVLGKNGELVGYGGGLWRKQYLLDLERRNP